MPYTFKHGDRPLEGITVQRAVGRGGFGEVYYALTDSGKQVALKYLRENPDIELRGIGHVMNLKSPHLITIYDVKRNPAGEPFVIMEYVSGPSLREMLMAEPGGFSPQKAAYLLSGIAKGLSYLHERGIVHRDLKPANIFYDDGYVKIGDYGLSKHISVSKHSGQTVSVGTVHYMAPEIGSGNYTKAIDIYALGVILYEMLTGRLPFSGASMGEILMRHLRDNPDLAGIPAPFVGVITKALAKNPEERYQDADEMLAAVMESADISQDLASFDATALSQVPRTPEASDPERTVTTPHRAPVVPSLDVRATEFVGSLDERLQKRLDHFARRLEEKAARLERKFGPGQRRARAERPIPLPGAAPRLGLGDRFLQTGALVIVAIMVAVLLGFLHGGRNMESRVAAIAFYIIGGTAGLLVAYLKLLPRWPTRGTVFERLVGAAIAGLFMLPGLGIAVDEVARADRPLATNVESPAVDVDFGPDFPGIHASGNAKRGTDSSARTPWRQNRLQLRATTPEPGTYLARMIFAPLVTFVLCDWSRRINAGRTGQVSAKAAFWPGFIGLVAAGVAQANDYQFVGAGVCATIALLAPSAAALWSPAARAAAVPERAAPQSGAPRAACCPPIVPPTAPPRTTAEPPPAPVEAAPVPIVVNAAGPSFAGQARSGTSFLGKLLLTIGLLLVLGQPTALYYAQQAVERGNVHVNERYEDVLQHGVSPGLGLAAVGLGGLLLVIARPRATLRGFFRRFMGFALTAAAAVVAVVAGAEPLRILFTAGADGGLDSLTPDSMWGPLAVIGLMLPIGLLLLFWPHDDKDRPIIV